MPKAPEIELTGADKEWGYRFGCDGVVNMDEACRTLGGIHRDTVKTKASEGLLRIGKHPNGRWLVVCRRSMEQYIASMEI